jgi:F-type H+-transporting ATPase subunit delta
MNLRIAHRYAQALMDLGVERNSLEKISEDLIAVETTIRESRPLRAMLASPVVKPDQKLKIFTEIFGQQLHPETLSFVKLLVTKGRAEYLFATAEEFRRMLDTRRNILHADIASAIDLSDEQRLIVQAKLENMTGKRIRPEFRTDPSLVGGFVARIGDRMVDASIRHQLELLREQFKHGGAPVLN